MRRVYSLFVPLVLGLPLQGCTSQQFGEGVAEILVDALFGEDEDNDDWRMADAKRDERRKRGRRTPPSPQAVHHAGERR
jgi:hypothetical protein